MSTARQDFGVGVIGGSMYAIGGGNMQMGYYGSALSSVELYSAATNRWNDE